MAILKGHVYTLLGLSILFTNAVCTTPIIHAYEPEGQQDEVKYVEIGRTYDESKTYNSIRQISERCDGRDKSSIFTYGRCDNVCVKFNPATFLTEATKCAPLLQFGCAHQACRDFAPELGFSCSLDPARITEVVTCPGDKIVFDGIDIKTFEKISYKIDLNAPPVKTDVYFLADNTGSMSGAISTARNNAVELTNVFGSRPSVAFGVGRYGDETQFGSGFQNLLSVVTSKTQAQQAIRKWTASGGGDTPEANLVALYKVATESSIGWREGSRKILVYFGDAPGHEPTCLGGKAITRKLVYDALKAKGITVVAANFGNLDASTVSYPRSGCGGVSSSGGGQATDITKETGGDLVSSRDQAKLIQLIAGLLNSLLRTYDVDESECVAKITSVHTPTLPLSLKPEESAVITNTIELKPSICETGSKFNCRYKYTESGAALAGDAEIEFVNIKGC